MTEVKFLLSPEQFKDLLFAQDNRVDAARVTNELMDDLNGRYPAPKTLGNKLTTYRKVLKGIPHPKPELNVTFETTGANKTTVTQHFALEYLVLSDEQLGVLGQQREDHRRKISGFDLDGELREVEKPSLDITETIKECCELIKSSDHYTVACGILPLIGRRANELNQPKRYDETLQTVIERDWIVVDKFMVGFRGITKKGGDTNYYVFPSLIPADLIVKAIKRYQSFTEVQQISPDKEVYRRSYQDTFGERFKEIWGEKFSTIAAYNDDGILTKADGTTHKARAFYACAIRAILGLKKTTRKNAQDLIIQQCLCHSEPKETTAYLARFDVNEFINPPTNVIIPTTITKYGKMTTEAIEKLKNKPEVKKVTRTKAPKATPIQFDINKFIDSLPEEDKLEFGQHINTLGITQALINYTEKLRDLSTKPKEVIKSVKPDIERIFVAVMDYNAQQTQAKDKVFPSYAVVNEVHKQVRGTELNKKTVQNIYLGLQNDIENRLLNWGIPSAEVPKLNMWNGTHFRRSMPYVIKGIIEVFNNS